MMLCLVYIIDMICLLDTHLVLLAHILPIDLLRRSELCTPRRGWCRPACTESCCRHSLWNASTNGSCSVEGIALSEGTKRYQMQAISDDGRGYIANKVLLTDENSSVTSLCFLVAPSYKSAKAALFPKTSRFRRNTISSLSKIALHPCSATVV